jgi:hypothetical protein
VISGSDSQSRQIRLRFLFLALFLIWVVFYEAGPARVQFQLVWASDHSWLYRALEPIFDLALPIFAIVFGFAVVFLRPDDIKAWLLLGLVLSFAEATRMGPDITAASPWLRAVAITYQSLGEHLWPAWFLLFLIYFPARAQSDVKWPWLKWLIVAPFTVNALLYIGQDLHIPAARQTLQSEGFLAPGIDYLLMAWALILLSTRYFAARTGDQRRRLRLFYWGILLTLLPALAMAYTRDLLHKKDLNFAPGWIVLTAFGLLTLFPAVLAYVIVVQHAMDVRVVVRQGIRYAFARNGVAVLRAVGVAVVILAAVRLSELHAGLTPEAISDNCGGGNRPDRRSGSACAHLLPVDAILAHVIKCVDSHAAGAPQHDDMTLVAVRALPVA